MKKRSVNCWLMQSRIVAAVATISVQRQKPLQRADAGDFGLVQAGSLTHAGRQRRLLRCGGSRCVVRDRSEDIVDMSVSVLFRSQTAGFDQKSLGMPAFDSAAARAFIQPSTNSLASAGGLALV